MARKSHRSSRTSKKLPDQKQEIAQLLDRKRQTHNAKDVADTHNGKKKDAKELALEKQFSSIIEKFKIPDARKGRGQLIVKEEVAKGIRGHERDHDHDLLKEDPEKPKSKTRGRKQDQPSLSRLKCETSYPQMVEWYDCDAMYPHLLVSIKTSKNVVPVPGHWQMKREYLSGRSLLEKRPFELPEIIRQTDIEQMRKTLPDGEDDDSTLSSKQVSRTRVQPKLGTLDIGYAKLRDVFFKLGAKWKPDVLLPFGDLYYENRNLHEESEWRKFVKEKEPGKLSTELREIMNLKEGQLPPWCMKMKSLGMPPGYPTLKIAGLNMGIENLSGDTYGRLERLHNKKRAAMFGAIISLEDDAQEQKGKKSIKKEEQKLIVPAAIDSKLGPLGENLKIEINRRTPTNHELSETASEPGRNSQRESKQLYTVLPERKADDMTANTGSKSMYEVLPAGKHLATNTNLQDEYKLKSDGNEDEESIDKFRF
ncbi:hypothetical protein HG535_0F00880 [Zygotorulaspora mrakii]|uniref:PSP proline-rich domain-containing protein n=1 Tax=Zygotorulaspora mrakii TaxID=42260 RepID=A0A7H9B4G3_ZYGMR|nr:uncharacterized protein HG535_0F00880 [Zygotorulaspora mrakii]QLG73578.1 hypothetical protein HG535_0F00880 [Zygotorulaspora mrakii]